MYSAVVNFVAGKEQIRWKPVCFQRSATMSSGETHPARPFKGGWTCHARLKQTNARKDHQSLLALVLRYSDVS